MAIVKAENALKDIPLVSIIAVCYNHSRYVEETLNSILNQTYGNIELIIIDSNSSDNSVQIIEHWIKVNSVECTFIKQTTPRNISQNLNEGLSLLNGDFFQGLSCDDIIAEEKISKQVGYFHNQDSNVCLIYGDSTEIDENSNDIEYSSFLNKLGYKYSSQLPKGDVFFKLMSNYFISAPTVLLRTSHVKSIGGFNKDYFMEDLYLILKLANQYSITGYLDVVAKYRVLPSSVMHSTTPSVRQKEVLKIISEYLGKKGYIDRYILYQFTLHNKHSQISALNYIFKLIFYVTKIKLKKEINEKKQ